MAKKSSLDGYRERSKMNKDKARIIQNTSFPTEGKSIKERIIEWFNKKQEEKDRG